MKNAYMFGVLFKLADAERLSFVFQNIYGRIFVNVINHIYEKEFYLPPYWMLSQSGMVMEEVTMIAAFPYAIDQVKDMTTLHSINYTDKP